MIENRQSLADASLTKRTPLTQVLKVWLRYKSRKLAYSFAPLRRLLEREKLDPEAGQAYWDNLMAQPQFSTYLGGTINVDAVNAMTALLIKYHSVDRPAVLDMGCSGGTLVSALHRFARYLGSDISTVAIAAAQNLALNDFPDRQNDIAFTASDLRQFQTSSTFDVIVFNEVLYILNTDQAVAEVLRFSKFLTLNGLIVVSMKDDGKSHAIFDILLRHFDWVDGILWQRKAIDADFCIRLNRERPAFLIGAFKVRRSAGDSNLP